MTITSIPTKTAGDLGTILTNVRPPVVNEFSAINLEKIKDRIIEIFTEVGLSDGSTPGSVWEAILALVATTTVTLPIESGETIMPGQAVAASAVPGRCRRANAIGNAAPSFIGICVTGGVGNGPGTVNAVIRASGVASGLAVTANTPVYLSTAAIGGVTSTVPTGSGNLSLQIGWAVSGTQAVLHMGLPIIL
jgi:hypothetical protein